jgi:tetratricopeptide (TPR) repeat protein
MRRLATLIGITAALSAASVRADSVGDVQLGNVAYNDGRYEAAVEAFTRAILAGDLEPEALAIAFNNRGVAYSELGDFDRAVDDASQALALAPDDTVMIGNLRKAHLRRAAAARELGDREAARADYDRAIAVDPAHPTAYLRRGQLALEVGDREAAIADLTRGRDLDPTNADAIRLLAETDPVTPADEAGATVANEAARSPSASPAPGPPPAAPPASAAVAPDYSIDPPGGSPAPVPDPAPGAGPVAASTVGAGRAHRAIQDVNVRLGPGNSYPRIGSLAQGATVLVVGERQGWLEVSLVGGGRGYVYRRWLEDVGVAGAGAP